MSSIEPILPSAVKVKGRKVVDLSGERSGLKFLRLHLRYWIKEATRLARLLGQQTFINLSFFFFFFYYFFLFFM